MKIPFFGKTKYQAPQISPVPEGQAATMSGTYINEERREILVRIFDGGKPEDLALAIGTIRIAEDIIKQTISLWHTKEQRRSALLVPCGTNGKGGPHVI